MPEARGNPQPAAVVLDQTISWNRIQWYWLWRSPDRFTLRAENYSCLQTPRIQPLFQPTSQPNIFLIFIPHRQSFTIICLVAGGNILCFLTLTCNQTSFVHFVFVGTKDGLTRKKKKDLRKRDTSQRESSASRCGFWIRLYPGIQYRNISCYRAWRVLYWGQENKPFRFQARIVSASRRVTATLILAKDKTLETVINRDKTSRFYSWLSFPASFGSCLIKHYRWSAIKRLWPMLLFQVLIIIRPPRSSHDLDSDYIHEHIRETLSQIQPRQVHAECRKLQKKCCCNGDDDVAIFEG